MPTRNQGASRRGRDWNDRGRKVEPTGRARIVMSREEALLYRCASKGARRRFSHRGRIVTFFAALVLERLTAWGPSRGRASQERFLMCLTPLSWAWYECSPTFAFPAVTSRTTHLFGSQLLSRLYE